MVDVSHISKQAMLDAVELSASPVIASHSSVTALADVARNMDDEQLDALAEDGGVIQIVALDSFVKEVSAEKRRAIDELRDSMGIEGFAGVRALEGDRLAEYQARMAEIDEQWPRASVSDFVDHIDYAVERIGIEHVGISSDFNGGGGVEGWDDASETPNVTAESAAARLYRGAACTALGWQHLCASGERQKTSRRDCRLSSWPFPNVQRTTNHLMKGK